MGLYLQTKPKNWFSRASIGYVTSDLAFNTGPNSIFVWADIGKTNNVGPEVDRKWVVYKWITKRPREWIFNEVKVKVTWIFNEVKVKGSWIFNEVN